MKTPDTIAEDIYKYLESYGHISDEAIEELILSLSTVLKEKLQGYRVPSLSMSSIGKPARKVWMDINNPTKPSGKDRLKFLYGDIIETFVLWLCKQAGHTVERQQESTTVDGIKGSIDAIIDGKYLCDVKSASEYSFKKFKEKTLPMKDSFGYLAQISGYQEGLGGNLKPFFLAVNKVSGEICTYFPDEDFDLVNVHDIIKEKKEVLKSKEMPDKPCTEPVEIGSSGNKGLSVVCKLCPHKFDCWKDLRVFKYSKGTEYLTTVVKEPRVEEVTNEHK